MAGTYGYSKWCPGLSAKIRKIKQEDWHSFLFGWRDYADYNSKPICGRDIVRLTMVADGTAIRRSRTISALMVSLGRKNTFHIGKWCRSLEWTLKAFGVSYRMRWHHVEGTLDLAQHNIQYCEAPPVDDYQFECQKMLNEFIDQAYKHPWMVANVPATNVDGRLQKIIEYYLQNLSDNEVREKYKTSRASLRYHATRAMKALRRHVDHVDDPTDVGVDFSYLESLRNHCYDAPVAATSIAHVEIQNIENDAMCKRCLELFKKDWSHYSCNQQCSKRSYRNVNFNEEGD